MRSTLSSITLHFLHLGLETAPLYLEWAGLQTTASNIDSFCAKFSTLVFQAVIDAPWVPGVKEYLLAHYQQQVFILVLATPSDEIVEISGALGIFRLFKRVYVHLHRKTRILRRSCKSRVVPRVELR